MCELSRVTDFDQITSDRDAQKLLKELYNDVDKVEFYVGLCAEDVRTNSTLSPLMGQLVVIDAFSQALTNPLLAKNIFNPQTFSPVGWEEIQRTNTLSDLVNRNSSEPDKKYRVTFYRHGDR
jgi:prostaglandin-endoperoxide synthase 2